MAQTQSTVKGVSVAAMMQSAKKPKNDPMRNLWRLMIYRCHNPKAANYHRYGGKGVTVCSRWRLSFEAFVSDVGPRPYGMWLDRIDNSKGYEPGNCRWATVREQQNNRSNNVKFEFDGERLTIWEIGRRTGLNARSMNDRIRRRGVSLQDAINFQLGVKCG